MAEQLPLGCLAGILTCRWQPVTVHDTQLHSMLTNMYPAMVVSLESRGSLHAMLPSHALHLGPC
jgi:hypothetical protein